MPIQLAISQPDGTVPTYHVIMRIDFDTQLPRALVQGGSWLDKAHYTAAAPQVAGFNFDVSSLLAQPAPQPSGNFGPQVVSTIEEYLLTLQQFAGGTQVA
jgi:hypothetical protein